MRASMIDRSMHEQILRKQTQYPHKQCLPITRHVYGDDSLYS